MVAVHDSYAASIAVTSRLSSLGYSGEHFDAKAQQQYLRARFYDPGNGRFNRLDPFAGNMQDPQSLHKYAYVHGDPIGFVDPTGLTSSGEVGTVASVNASITATAQVAFARAFNFALRYPKAFHFGQRALAIFGVYSVGTADDPGFEIAMGPVGMLDDVGDVVTTGRQIHINLKNIGLGKKGFGIFEDLDVLNRARGFFGRITQKDVNGPLGSTPTIDPVGYQELRATNPPGGVARGHLHANVHNGTGKLQQNLVTLHQPANQAMFDHGEALVRDALNGGKYPEAYVYVKPIYNDDDRIPAYIVYEAWGIVDDVNSEKITRVIIQNSPNPTVYRDMN